MASERSLVRVLRTIGLAKAAVTPEEIDRHVAALEREATQPATVEGGKSIEPQDSPSPSKTS
jgi:hypothetical protein